MFYNPSIKRSVKNSLRNWMISDSEESWLEVTIIKISVFKKFLRKFRKSVENKEILKSFRFSGSELIERLKGMSSPEGFPHLRGK